MKFIYAAELKKQYKCFGHFYELLLEDGSRSKCRSVLEIVDYSKGEPHVSMLSERQPDAVVIMMNPGSSRPMDKSYVPSTIQYNSTSSTSKELVLTMPDTTQYQVMRLMHSQKWEHVRVLNLSDLREPKSHLLFKAITEIEARIGGECHSIFCKDRDLEIKASLKRKNGAPIIVAWGLDSFLLPLARLCLETVGVDSVVGIPSRDDSDLFFHPSPMLHKSKVKWLDDVIGLL